MRLVAVIPGGRPPQNRNDQKQQIQQVVRAPRELSFPRLHRRGERCWAYYAPNQPRHHDEQEQSPEREMHLDEPFLRRRLADVRHRPAHGKLRRKQYDHQPVQRPRYGTVSPFARVTLHYYGFLNFSMVCDEPCADLAVRLSLGFIIALLSSTS